MALGIGNAGRRSGGAIPTVETILVNGSPRTSAKVGDVLTVFYPPKGLTAPTQQALRNGTAITGATGFSYTTVSADQTLPITFSGTGLSGLAYTTAAVTVAALAVDAPTTNIPGGTVTLDETAQTATLSGTATDDGVYSYDPAAVAAGLPQFLRVNTLSITGNDYNVNDDGIYLAPADDLPDMLTRTEVGGALRQTTLPYTLTASDGGLLVEIILVLENDATVAAETSVEAALLVQEAASFAGTLMQPNGGYLQRSNAGVAGSELVVSAVWFKRTSTNGNTYFLNLDTAAGATGMGLKLDNSFQPSGSITTQTGDDNTTIAANYVSSNGPAIPLNSTAVVVYVTQVGQEAKVYTSIDGAAFTLTQGPSNTLIPAGQKIKLATGKMMLSARHTGGGVNAHQFYRAGIWRPAAAPDLTDPGVAAKFRDAAGKPTAISVINGLLGSPMAAAQGPAAQSTTDYGTGPNFTQVGSPFTDVPA